MIFPAFETSIYGWDFPASKLWVITRPGISYLNLNIPWRIHGAAILMVCQPDPINKNPSEMLAFFYQHQPDPSWVLLNEYCLMVKKSYLNLNIPWLLNLFHNKWLWVYSMVVKPQYSMVVKPLSSIFQWLLSILNVTPIPWSSVPVVVSHVAPGLHQHAGIQQASTRLRKPPESTGVRLHVTDRAEPVVRMGKSLKNGG